MEFIWSNYAITCAPNTHSHRKMFDTDMLELNDKANTTSLRNLTSANRPFNVEREAMVKYSGS